MVTPAVETRSLLNLGTLHGFQGNNRGFRSLLIGVDVSSSNFGSVQMYANVVARGGNQNAALETFFYQLCNFSRAPLTPLFAFDGPGRPSVKRNTRVIKHPQWLVEHLKHLILSFGYHFHEAPGEAEAELAQLNKLGFIDAVITEDSDTLVFGGSCVIRTLGQAQPSVEDDSAVYFAESLQNTLSLSQGELLLFTLLSGGDYDPGIEKCGGKIAYPLAVHFGQELLAALALNPGSVRRKRLDDWRNALRRELRTNSSGYFDRRQRRLADRIPDTFPDLEIVQLYLDPFTSWSPRFAGTPPDPSLWTPKEPLIPELSKICRDYFSWNGDQLLKRLAANLWPGAAFRMLCSVCLIHFNPTN
ncbi:PIN domain-like protein [Mycena rebaudengoi]|nr:PIN domain-like protein [Mycena rebaudengoi]